MQIYYSSNLIFFLPELAVTIQITIVNNFLIKEATEKLSACWQGMYMCHYLVHHFVAIDKIEFKNFIR
jgi:hypothetical protein